MSYIGAEAICLCGKKFKKKTPWHDSCSGRCRLHKWAIKKGRELEAARLKPQQDAAKTGGEL